MVATSRSAFGLAEVKHHDDEMLRLLSKELLDEVLSSEDAKEGLSAFIEERPPRWTAR